MSWLETELREQPEALARLLERGLPAARQIALSLDDPPPLAPLHARGARLIAVSDVRTVLRRARTRLPRVPRAACTR